MKNLPLPLIAILGFAFAALVFLPVVLAGCAINGGDEAEAKKHGWRTEL